MTYDQLDQCFSKLFEFEGTSNLNLNSDLCFKLPLWLDPRLDKLKCELNQVKSQLSDKNIREWTKHTHLTDISAFVLSQLKRKRSKHHLITRGWIKMHEILSSYPILLTSADSKLSVLFLCEIPGGFADCVSNYVKAKHFQTKFKWQAVSFNPYYEQLDIIEEALFDDRFLRHSNVFNNWSFGYDNTGDILSPSFLQWFLSNYSKQQFDLVTADAGINCISNPSGQEEMTLPLLLVQILCAINCLKDNGCLVIKFFSLFECQTICLIYLLYNLFHQLIAFKPMSSKEGNSEVYFVCLNFLSTKSQFVNELTNLLLNKIKDRQSLKHLLSSYCLFDESTISHQFLIQFIKCSTFFKRKQEAAIVNNLNIFNNPERDKIYKSLIVIKRKIVKKFYQKFGLGLSQEHDEDCPFINLTIKRPNIFNLNLYDLNDLLDDVSFNERKANFKRVNYALLRRMIAVYNLKELDRNTIKWRRTNDFNLSQSQFKPIKGKAYRYITNSPFIDTNLLHLFYTLAANHQKPFQTLSRARFDQYTICRSSMLIETLLRETGLEDQQVSIIGRSESPLVETVASIVRIITSNKADVFENKDNLKDTLSPKLFVIDPFESEQKFDHQSVDLVISEGDNFLPLLLTSLSDIISILDPKNIIVIRAQFTLSRIFTGLLYTLSRIYHHIAVIPSFVVQNDQDKSHNDYGQLLFFANLSTHIKDEGFDCNNLMDYIKIALHDKVEKKDEMLLEIIKPPLILSGW